MSPSRTVQDYIRTIPDFPHEGIMFRDVTTLFLDPRGLRLAIDQLLAPYVGQQIDKIAGLEARGENLYLETGSSGTPLPGNPGLNGLGTLQQGFVEGSNVNVVEEMVNMIETQRAYEMNSKAISTADQMLQYVSQNL